MKQTFKVVTVVGGGLAGAEAAWQLAERGIFVNLYEMRPNKQTPAHETSFLSEIVCSNSFGGATTITPAGILKEELRKLNSLLLECAEATKVPAGNALAVDRDLFAKMVDAKISQHSKIKVIREECLEIPEGPTIIATGPLTSSTFAKQLKSKVGENFLYFYDAVAPIITTDSIDDNFSFKANRYGDSGDYINCPMDEETYDVFWNELINAETAPRHSFEDEEMRHFERCLPVEVIAKRGKQTLLFGPLRPVGLAMESNEEKAACAVVQLRQDNEDGTLYNMVGFQTSLKWGEQERVFRLIPALKNAEFVRKGVMHRNLFVCAPTVLDNFLRLNGEKSLFLAGQITGVEGYVESISMGMAASIFMFSYLKGFEMPLFPKETAIGSLLNYLNTAIPDTFQPMNLNLGIFPKIPGKKIYKRALRCEAYAKRSKEHLEKFVEDNNHIFF